MADVDLRLIEFVKKATQREGLHDGFAAPSGTKTPQPTGTD